MTTHNNMFDPSVDYLFKMLMQEKKVALSFLETVIQVPIKSIEFSPLEPKTNKQDAKAIIFDFACILNGSIIVVVEMQKRHQSQEKLLDRIIYYHNRSGVQGFSRGQDYQQIKEQYTLVLCTKSPFKTEDYTIEFNYMNKKYNIRYPKTHLIFYDMERAYDLFHKNDMDTLEPEQIWLLFFMSVYKKMSKEYIESLLLKEELKMAKEVIDNSAKDLLAAVVKSLDGMADGEDGMYFQEIREELAKKDNVINQMDKVIKESKETINNLMNELAKYKSNYAQS